MTVPFWGDDDERGYDEVSFIVNGLTFTFATTKVVVDGELAQDLDIQKGPGYDLGTVRPLGVVPVEPTVTVTLFRAEHWTTWQRALVQLQPRPSKTPPRKVVVVHPLLQAHGLRDFYVRSLSIPQPENGIAQGRIKLAQYVKPRKAIKQETQIIVDAPDQFATGAANVLTARGPSTKPG